MLIIIALGVCSAFGQSDLITNVNNRQTFSLNGKWHYIIDPYETGYYDFRYHPYDASERTKGNSSAFYNNAKAKNKLDRVEYNFDASSTLLVPGDWNSQDDRLLYYEGTIWYKRSFDYVTTDENARVFLHFGAVNYIAEVYLNGEKLGVHEGGFTPFNFEVGNLLKSEDNYLVVKVDNTRSKDAVPTLNTDWWNYGGITRDVQLIEVPSTYIQDYVIQLKRNEKNQIAGFVKLSGENANTNVNVTIQELNIQIESSANEDGMATFDFTVDDLEYWTPKNPKLYDVVIKTSSESLSATACPVVEPARSWPAVPRWALK